MHVTTVLWGTLYEMPAQEVLLVARFLLLTNRSNNSPRTPLDGVCLSAKVS